MYSWHLLCAPDTDDIKQKNKNHETIPRRFFPEQKTKRSFVLRHLCPVHKGLTLQLGSKNNINETSISLVNHINPLSPNGDQHQFSPNVIHTMSRDKVMRIDKMITKVEIALIFYKILSTHSLKRCMEVSLENLYVDIGA